MILLDGKKTSADIKEEIALEVRELKNRGNKTPHLAAVIVGNDGASITYVNAKVKACERVGFESTLIRLPKETSEEDLLNEIAILNIDNDIDGFIVQLPLPKGINQENILDKVLPKKDVDGFNPINYGKMALGIETFLPATPAGIIELIKRYSIDLKGKKCLVIGRSQIVGRPISILLSQNKIFGNATVTVAHSRSNNLKEICLDSDIIISAIGIPEFIKEDMIKTGSIITFLFLKSVSDSNPKTPFFKSL